MSNIIPLPTAKGTATALDLFLRVGGAHYGQVEVLYAEGRLTSLRRAIFDASMLKHQLSFLKTLRDDGVELTLDPKAAELAALNRFDGRAKGAPWSGGILHLPDQFDESRCRRLAEDIAREAIEKQFDRVFSPTHYLRDGVLDRWFRIDMRLCELLRSALDREGGAHIAIDYVVIIDQQKLRDDSVRAALLSQLAPLPFENVVLRISHFGSDASPTAIKELINLLGRFHNFGHPVLIDHVGGMVGRALLSFGAASAIAHGLDEHHRFDASSWNRPKREPDPEDDEKRGGGAAKRVAVPLFDRSFTVPELTALANAKGGRLIVCQDPNCCRGLGDMIKHSKRHSITQEGRLMETLNRTPDQMRAQHFLDVELANVDRFGRQLKDLKPVVAELRPRKGQTAAEAAEKLVERLAKHSQRNEKMRSTLEHLHSVRGLDLPRAPEAHLAPRARSASPRR